MPRILGARPYNRRAIPPLWSGMGDISRARARSIGGNYFALGVDDQSLPCPSGTGLCPPFAAQVEAWRDDITSQAGTLPVDFLLAWVQIESAGSVCSDTQYSEVGIFQLMAGDNIAAGGTTVALQHPVPPCVAGQSSYVWRSAVSDDIANEQVRGGIQYVNYCRTAAEAYMATYGYTDQPGWTNNDWSYWAVVKMIHVSPVYANKLLAAGVNDGSFPADWDDMMTKAASVSGATPAASWTANARAVGLFGAGGGSLATAALGLLSGDNKFLVIAALGVGLLYLLHKNR